MTGCGPFLHDDPADRPPELTGSSQTLWSGPGRESFLLLPVIPAPAAPDRPRPDAARVRSQR